MKSWIIINKSFGNININRNYKKIFDDHHLLFGGNLAYYEKDDLIILIDGYVMPRTAFYKELKDYKKTELISFLFGRYEFNFINYIKGFFNIIIIKEKEIRVYNDYAGMKKYFWYASKDVLCITNSLNLLRGIINFELDEFQIPVYILMEHFINGKTMFRNVSFSMPSTELRIFKKNIKKTRYWNEEYLIKRTNKKTDFNDFAYKFNKLIKEYIDYFQPVHSALTLTGGNDSRMILASLLNIGHKSETFTFGIPDSFDGVVSKEISESFGLNHDIYPFDIIDSDWFSGLSERIVESGNSLINIHRAHRYFAVDCEKKKYPGVNMIFGGFMGGDFIKGIALDDYITPKLFRYWFYPKKHRKDSIKKILSEKYYIFNDDIINSLFEYFSELRYFKNKDLKINELFLNFDMISPIHDAQDPNIFMNFVDYVVCIFIDVDYWELLFDTKHNLLYRNHLSRNPLRRIKDPELSCKIINILYPELVNFMFSKNYSPQEYLNNKFYFLITKKYRDSFWKKYPSSFELGEWMKEYSEKEYENLNEVFYKYFDVDKLKNNLKNNKHGRDENYWHKFTNMLNLNKNFNYFIN